MNIIERLRVFTRKPRQVRDPFGTRHRTITYTFLINECWPSLSKEQKQEIIEWCKQNLWKDHLAYEVLAKLRNGEIKV